MKRTLGTTKRALDFINRAPEEDWIVEYFVGVIFGLSKVPWVVSQTWMSHVTYMYESYHTYVWVMSHMCASCHIFRSYVTYVWVMSHIGGSCHIFRSSVRYIHTHTLIHTDTHAYTCTHTRTDTHAHTCTHTHTSTHTSERERVCIVSHMNESCHIFMSHVTY